jgi:hypothetical protein
VRRLHRRRNCVTPEEFARLLGKGASSVRRWVSDAVADKPLPRQKTPVWDSAAPPIVVFNERKRAIYVEGINPEVLDSREKREMLAETLASDPPEGWGHLDMMVPDPRTAPIRFALRDAA